MAKTCSRLDVNSLSDLNNNQYKDTYNFINSLYDRRNELGDY